MTRKKGLPEVVLRAAMSLCHGAKKKVRVGGSELRELLLVQDGFHYGTVFSPALHTIEGNVIT